MPDSVRVPVRLRPAPITAAAATYTPQEFRSASIFGSQAWQAEAWGFRRTLGEYSQMVDWQSRAMSRIRLGAAEVLGAGDEPEMLTEGPAADLMESFCGGSPGQSAFMSAITPHITVPGEGWLIAERADSSIPLALADWGVYPTEALRPYGNTFQVRVGQSLWRTLLPDNLPMRIFRPDPQYPWYASSNSEAAIPIMRRISLIDSRIIAMMVSRLASNGIMLIPQEGTISVPVQYKDAPDQFVAHLLATASNNIANPGSAGAAIPIPIKFQGDLIDKWKILKPDDPLPKELLDGRTAELGRLGDSFGISRERISGGMGQQNHWGQWQATDDETRIVFAPDAELICGAVTKAYLQPMLAWSGLSLLGPRGGKIIAWYDLSEITARPDKSTAAMGLYGLGELSPEALRRECGFGEADAPTTDELRQMIYLATTLKGTQNLDNVSFTELTGLPVPAPERVTEAITPSTPAADIISPSSAGSAPVTVAPAAGPPIRPAVPTSPRPAAIAASAGPEQGRPPGRRRYAGRHSAR
jgi:hypothetical protein